MHHHNNKQFNSVLSFELVTLRRRIPSSAPAAVRSLPPFSAISVTIRRSAELFVLWLLLTDRFAVCLWANRSPKILDNSMQNVTAMRGDTVEFRCRVENGAKSKVAFFRDELPPKLVAYDESVFRRTDKYELLARVNGGKEWILRIRDVQEDDAGMYICQLNTNPVLSRRGLLELRIPPSISRSSTPGAVEVREGNNVTMTCTANGNPKPTIVWRRSDRRIIRYNEADGYGDTVHKGAELPLSRVSRRHMGEYVCVASNGIPPDETLAIKLHVLFEPVVVPQSVVAEAPLNALVVRIACTVEAWPRPNVVWMFDGQMLHDSSRYGTEQSVADRYKSVHILEIRNAQKEQFGVYKCVASNDYGSHFGEIRLIEVPRQQLADHSPVASLSEEIRRSVSRGLAPAQFTEQLDPLRGGAVVAVPSPKIARTFFTLAFAFWPIILLLLFS
ncbi:hypothetical protein niasHS_007185 [Heterodera schachtii]|uniref:Ig-like domain-containing protein n=1 Tax=Heterodera schachtii TaxID=97005 RepID=A0ABD2JJM6_HETSC